MQEKVFISYSSVDKNIADSISDVLDTLGIDYFHDEKAINLGDNITLNVQEEINNSTSVIVIISPASLKSRWVFFEIGQANAFKKTIITFLTHPSLDQDLPFMLHGSKHTSSIDDITKFYVKKVFNNTKNKKYKCEEKIKGNNFIISIGGANSEYTIKLSETFKRGQKHQAELSKTLFGGSGLNISLRLLNMGFPVLPVLTVGNDIEGHNIQKSILKAIRDNKHNITIKKFIQKNGFFVPGAVTPRSTIIVDLEDRHIIKEDEKGIEKFTNYIEEKLDYIEQEYKEKISAITIGHIRSDSQKFIKDSPGHSTKYIINKFSKHFHIFANLGSSQISEGFEYWKDDISKIDILQLHIDEMKTFFSSGKKPPTLSEIVERLIKLNLTAIVTLDEFGAIATCKDAGDHIIIAYPFEMDNIIDPTGAGDAFGAGIISHLSKFKKISFSNLYNAINEARFWAAYACQHLGGSSQCPNKAQLETFKNNLNKNNDYSLDVMNVREADKQLRTIEKAFLRRRRYDI